MPVLLSDLWKATKERYKLGMLAGAKDMEVPVNWVHLVEDASVAPYFWGGELIVTTGVAATHEEWLLHLAQTLHARQISGILINTGMYVTQIPQQVIDFCEDHHLPLWTMPWEIPLSEVIKDYCMRIVMGTQNDTRIADAFTEAILHPRNEAAYLKELQPYFAVEGQFQVVAFRIEFPQGTEIGTRLQAADVMRTLLSHSVRKFSLFRLEGFYVLVLHIAEKTALQELLAQLAQRCRAHKPPMPIHIGVGQVVADVRNLNASYRRARAAARKADYEQKETVYFAQMGIDQLLYGAEDPDVLADFYHETLAPLEAYDAAHGGALVETLFQDMCTGGSVQKMAAAMYTHRNTINYRLAKIKEILGQDLSDPAVRTRCHVAFYIRDVLQAMQKKEQREGKAVRWHSRPPEA